ncbi:glutamate-1-semialdehyde 2,1-aminomutase [Flaviflexus massiliensis]|uniref:glutamate-1-semialdehyde 2,1-aminomutase n=1 Tax=Flaviflexus massiliensis TaxID=1522309 RepID=UPI0006D58C26|nr:glutamate-1-semialdehyde 2,1-aminomutase [Flaviflexus massiliensis]
MSDLFTRAQAVIPGGVDSPVRAFGSVGGAPVFIHRASGPHVYSGDRQFIDLVGSWGPALLGHAHPHVVAAVQEAAARGLSFGAPTEAEVELAELVIDRIPPVEKIRFVSTGTEATMTAIRLARGFTGRDLVVKFAGCYHGHEDSMLVAAGSGVATFGMSSSAGVPKGTVEDTVVLPYNDRQAVTDLFASYGDCIAAIITEAAPANMGLVPPLPGFNAFLKDECEKAGALLILDEVLTGFRLSRSGMWGIDQEVPYTPDLMAFGKVIGGGMPIAALGGRQDVMDYLAPLGPVYQAGTLSGNPLATAAGIATLTLADNAVYEKIDRASVALSNGFSEALTKEGVAHTIQRVGSLFSILFSDRPATNYDEVATQDQFRFPPFFHSLLEDGIHLPPSVFEAYFVSVTHDDAIIDQILEAAPKAARAAARAS